MGLASGWHKLHFPSYPEETRFVTSFWKLTPAQKGEILLLFNKAASFPGKSLGMMLSQDFALDIYIYLLANLPCCHGHDKARVDL